MTKVSSLIIIGFNTLLTGFGNILVLSLILTINVNAQIFTPKDVSLWDIWCYHNEQTWYMYFLSSTSLKVFDGFSVATSEDGVHWEMNGTPIRTPKGIQGGLGTGYTWKSPKFLQDSTFYCNFTVDARPQNGGTDESSYIRFAESRDLLNWEILEPEFRPDPRWYKEDYRWDCIKSIPREGGGYYGYWTAAPLERLGFGFGETDDGIHWRALPPPILEWGSYPVPEEVEVGGVGRIGDKYYALLTAFTRSKKDFNVVTFTADSPAGPFTAAPENFYVLPGLNHTWFPGFFPSPEGLLVTHFSLTTRKTGRMPVCTAAPLKRALVDRDGALRLAWWEGNQSLKGIQKDVEFSRKKVRNNNRPAFPDETFDIQRGTILEGDVKFSGNAKDEFPGICFETTEGDYYAILLISSSATAGGKISTDATGFEPDQEIDRDMPLRKKSKFRLLARHDIIELYLDDILFNVYSLPLPAMAKIGFLNNGKGIREIKYYTMTLPDQFLPE